MESTTKYQSICWEEEEEEEKRQAELEEPSGSMAEFEAPSGSMVLCKDGNMWEMVDFDESESDQEIFPCLCGETDRELERTNTSDAQMDHSPGSSSNPSMGNRKQKRRHSQHVRKLKVRLNNSRNYNYDPTYRPHTGSSSDRSVACARVTRMSHRLKE